MFRRSNTFGQRAEGPGRWPIDIRWTGRLQELLGDGYSIIEEGLGGRTTDLDDPERNDRNGLTYFQRCLRSHSPLGIVIIMLGTNDLKARFDRSPDNIAAALDSYVDCIASTAWTRTGGVPVTLLVGPIHLDATKPGFVENSSEYNADSVCKSRALAAVISRLADKRGALFLDASTVAHAGYDGTHLSSESHESLSRLIAQEVRTRNYPSA
ncbi:GDSL-type esterase/lipase family protein [Nocardia wallacei]|nr:GDSL-type esterase/lipase family protein [Nocardia wallacei]